MYQLFRGRQGRSCPGVPRLDEQTQSSLGQAQMQRLWSVPLSALSQETEATSANIIQVPMDFAKGLKYTVKFALTWTDGSLVTP